MDYEIFAALRNILAYLYSDEFTIRRVIADAGINSARVQFNSTAENIWHSVLTEAEKNGQVNKLFTLAQHEYKRNAELQDTLRSYQQLRDYLFPQASNESEQLEQAIDRKNQTTTINVLHKIESPYGTMWPNSNFYIVRDADEACLNHFKGSKATTIYVQSPRQMGKSSLMQRTVAELRQTDGVLTAFIDFEKFAQAQLSSLDDFLTELCFMIGDALDLPEAIDKYWSSPRRSPLVKCSNYLSKYIIPTIRQPLIVAMDEVERILGTPFQDDFFGMLRTWHNDRAHEPNFWVHYTARQLYSSFD